MREEIRRIISLKDTEKFAWPEPVREAVVEVDGVMKALPASSLSFSDLQRSQSTSGGIALGRLQAGWTRRVWLVSTSGPKSGIPEAVEAGFAVAGDEATLSEERSREAENPDRVSENSPQDDNGRGLCVTIRCAPSLTGTPEHIEHDFSIAQELLQALQDDGVKDVVVEGTLKERLDRLITRLRVLHHVCFYCATAYACTEELLAECGPVHMRDALLSNPRCPASKGTGLVADDHQRQQEHVDWLDRKLRRLVESLRVHLQPISMDDWLVQHHVRAIDDSKAGCRHCTKLFRSADFVLKHLRLKHGDAVSSAERKLAALNVLLAAPRSLLPPSMLPFVPFRRARPLQPTSLGRKRSYQEDQGDASMRRPLKRYVDLDAPHGIADADISYD